MAKPHMVLGLKDLQPSKAKRNPTMRDVATLAGVSPSTVSLVLSGRKGGKTRISAETKARIQDAVTQLDYVPSQLARQLRKSSTERICLVLPHLRPFDNALIKKLNLRAAEQGYSVIINVSEGEAETLRILRQCRAGLADALLILLDHSNTVYATVDEQLKLLAEADLAVVVMGDGYTSAVHDVVMSTVEYASYEATAYLLGQGRRVGFIGHTLEAAHYPRYRGFLSAHADQGLVPDATLLSTGAADYKSGFQATAQMLAARPTALLCASDVAAIGALACLRQTGYSVPDDVAVIGMGNIPESQMTAPALSTIGPKNLNFDPVVELLLERLADPNLPPRQREQPWHLILRDST